MLFTPGSAPVNFAEGTFLPVDKPLEWTSFDVVNKLRYALRRHHPKIKVGHAGTLDPLASGLLLICTGKMTRQINTLMGLDKIYTGSICLGGITPSYDRESAVVQEFPTDHITKELIEATCSKFIGEISQVPPIYSAIKKNGTAAYTLARRGEEVEMEPRLIHIYDFRITSIDMPLLRFEVHCSKGTYIRSLAHDFGKALGSGAYLYELCRTKIGPYSLEESWKLQDLVTFIQEMPKVEINEDSQESK